jgi:hypothetical protein
MAMEPTNQALKLYQQDLENQPVNSPLKVVLLCFGQVLNLMLILLLIVI